MASSSPSSSKSTAELALRRAEERFRANDLAGARIQARKASDLCSSLPGLHHMVTALDVLFAAVTKKLPSGGTDWFAVLGIDPSADLSTAKKRYMEPCLLTHPDKNPNSATADPAFKLVKNAWDAVFPSFASLPSMPPASFPSGGRHTPPRRPTGPAARPPSKPKKRVDAQYACPHCRALLPGDMKVTFSGRGNNVMCRMECPACRRWVVLQL